MNYIPVRPDVPRSVRLGRFTVGEEGVTRDSISLVCENPDLRRHLDRSWLLSYLSRSYQGQYGNLTKVLSATQDGNTTPAASDLCAVSEDTFARHSVLCGASGSGKTRLMVHLLAGQLPWGTSLIALDPKKETLLRLLHAAQEAGISPDDISLLLPGEEGEGCPGWNPLLPSPGVTLSSAVQGFVSIVKACSESWGPRLDDVLTNTALLIGAHGLTLLELVRFLQRPGYREALLALPFPELCRSDAIALGEAREFFEQEFSAWSSSEKTANVAPVLNKIRDFTSIPFLRALFCAKENALDLPSLWKRQRVILIHLDAATLGDDGTRLLAALLLHSMFTTATRAPGKVPVALAVDELGLSERFTGQALCRILAAAREYHLRLMVACQHMGQLSTDLQEALRTSTALRVYFRLGIDDARIISSTLSAGRGGVLKQIVLEPTPVEKGSTKRKDETPEPYVFETSSHPVLDGEGRELSRSRQAEAALLSQPHRMLACAGGDVDSLPVAVRNLRMLSVASGVARVYVRDALTQEMVEAGAYVRGLTDHEVSLTGGYPVELTVSYPRPRIGKVEKSSESELTQDWLRCLLNMPVQHAVVWKDSDNPRLVRVEDVSDALKDLTLPRFMGKVLQNWRDRLTSPEETETWRREGMEILQKNYLEYIAQEQEKQVIVESDKSRQLATEPTPNVIAPVILTPRKATYGEGRTREPAPKPKPKTNILHGRQSRANTKEVAAPPVEPDRTKTVDETPLPAPAEVDTTSVPTPDPPVVPSQKRHIKKKTPVLVVKELTQLVPETYDTGDDGSLA